MAKRFNVIARVDKNETWAINTALPIDGDPVIYAQGKNLTQYSAEVYSSEGVNSGSMVFGPQFSGEVKTSVKENRFSGTPYIVTQITSVGR